ncbi:MAG: 4a-hydroxytetrahydrobiopterin dehydratase [Planctomycetota bacterium]
MPEPMPADQINTALQDLPGWSFADDKLHKAYSFGSFKEAMSFMVRVGFEAEALGHHPELFNVYSTVKIALNTHDAGGKVTELDVKLAGAIESFAWTG